MPVFCWFDVAFRLYCARTKLTILYCTIIYYIIQYLGCAATGIVYLVFAVSRRLDACSYLSLMPEGLTVRHDPCLSIHLPSLSLCRCGAASLYSSFLLSSNFLSQGIHTCKSIKNNAPQTFASVSSIPGIATSRPVSPGMESRYFLAANGPFRPCLNKACRVSLLCFRHSCKTRICCFLFSLKWKDKRKRIDGSSS